VEIIYPYRIKMLPVWIPE